MALSYTQPLASDNAIGATMYAVVIPAGAISVSGAAIRVSLHGAANVSNMWIGHQGAGAIDFDGGQVQLKKSGASSFAMSGVTVLDAVAFALDETKPLVLRFDGQTSGTYKKATGLDSAFKFYYKGGQAGAANGNTTAQSGYEVSANGQTAFVTLIEAAATVEEFAGGGSSPLPEEETTPTGLGGMAEVKAGKMFVSGGVVAGVPSRMLLLSLFNPTGSGVNAFVRQVVLTADADTLITARSIVSNTGTLMPSRCNAWGDPAALASKAKLYRSDIAAFDGNTAQHDIFKVFAGVPYTVNKTAYPLWGTPPAGLGYCLALHELGVGLTAAFHWQEVPG